jgi:hypothetical protein
VFSGGAVLAAQLVFLGSEGEKGVFQRPGSATLQAQFLAGAEGDEAPLMDDADAVGHFLGDAQLVGGNENSHAGERALLEEVLDDAGVLGIKADHGFVNDEDFGIVDWMRAFGIWYIWPVKRKNSQGVSFS